MMKEEKYDKRRIELHGLCLILFFELIYNIWENKVVVLVKYSQTSGIKYHFDLILVNFPFLKK